MVKIKVNSPVGFRTWSFKSYALENVGSYFLLLGMYLVICFPSVQTTGTQTGCYFSGAYIPLGTNKTITNSSSFCVVYICNQDGTATSWEGFGQQCDGNKRNYSETTYGPGCVVSGIHIPLGTNKTVTNSSSFCSGYICNSDGSATSWEGFGQQCGGNQRTYPTHGPGCVVSGQVIPLGTNKTLYNSTSICLIYICNKDGSGDSVEYWGGC